MSDERCPKCGSEPAGSIPIDGGYNTWKCGSHAHKTGDCHQQSWCCQKLSSLTAAEARIAELESERAFQANLERLNAIRVEMIATADENHRLRDGVKALAEQLEQIVCVVPPDDGVVLLSNEGPVHYDAEQQCNVYDHEHFSPLGDALIAMHDKLTALLGEKGE